ncbi:chalcone isomerase family protein [Gemmata sp. JC673]|uniref:Chalcone isomerase family protein n=1 Tax=Gemmata algarum TaxID=2975278 RepID=A0ABU5EZZ5_9BACT|nr:chalcone isomerase family protein [Gemmata algarum]MDY3559363.1 chalcone isomerase family protein [Gemmata algarum]
MFRSAIFALVVAVVAGHGMAAEPVPVKGTSVAYAPTISATVKDKAVPLSLTGVGLRTKVGFDVYTVASYVQDGTRVQKAEDVAKTDTVRLLHLIMQRTVQPDDFIGAFRSAVGKSYPEGKFATEFTQLVNAIGKNAATKGDHVILLHVPGEGVRVQMGQKVDVTIKSPGFSQALWEVYFGSKPLDEGLKKGLVGSMKP